MRQGSFHGFLAKSGNSQIDPIADIFLMVA